MVMVVVKCRVWGEWYFERHVYPLWESPSSRAYPWVFRDDEFVPLVMMIVVDLAYCLEMDWKDVVWFWWFLLLMLDRSNWSSEEWWGTF